MKIAAVDPFYLRMPTVTSAADGTQDSFLVRVRTDDGLEAWGESDASPLVSAAVYCCPMSHGNIINLRETLVGETLEGPDDIRRLHAKVLRNGLDIQHVHHAYSAADLALWDVVGKKLGQPVYRLLDGSAAHPKRPYASVLFGDTPEQTRARAREQREAELAIDRGEDELAKEALQRRINYANSAAGLEEQWKAQSAQVQMLKDGLRKLESKISEAQSKQELLIALAGPAVTLAIAAVLYLVLRVSGGAADLDNLSPATPFVDALFRTNVFLLLFNLIPAFPMDGGRVLRALLATRMGLARATRTAATLGQMLAVAGGLAVLLSKNGNPVLLLIALFVFLGAGSEAAAMETRLAGRGLHVADMMVREFHTIPVHATLARAVELLLAGEQREFPVDVVERSLSAVEEDQSGRVELVDLTGQLRPDRATRAGHEHGLATDEGAETGLIDDDGFAAE